MQDKNSQRFLAEMSRLVQTPMFDENLTESMRKFKLQSTGEFCRPYTANYGFILNELTLKGNFDDTGVNKFPLIVQELVPMIEHKLIEMPELKDSCIYLSSQNVKDELFTDAQKVIAGLKTDDQYMDYINSHEMVYTQDGLVYANILLYLRVDVVRVPELKKTQNSDTPEFLVAYSIGTSITMALNADDCLRSSASEWTDIRDTLEERLKNIKGNK